MISMCVSGNAPPSVNATFEVLRCTPCLRIVVRNSDCLPIGKLYIVTCTSVATIGRDETLSHAILIPDPLVSKVSMCCACVRRSYHWLLFGLLCCDWFAQNRVNVDYSAFSIWYLNGICNVVQCFYKFFTLWYTEICIKYWCKLLSFC